MLSSEHKVNECLIMQNVTDWEGLRILQERFKETEFHRIRYLDLQRFQKLFQIQLLLNFTSIFYRP